VTAEHPAVVMALVDHDVPEPAQERRPATVLGQQGVGEHVRVRVQVAGVCARPVPVLPRGVAVEGRRAHPRQGEAADGRQLVPCQRLRRGEVERPRRRVLEQATEQRQQVAERLARRRTGREHDRRARPRRLRRGHLVGPRPLHADRPQPAAQQARHPLRPVHLQAGPGGHLLDVGDGIGATRIEQQAPQRRAGRRRAERSGCGHDHRV
jgi:hypothetical protein